MTTNFNGIKLFLNSREYTKKNRNEYLKNVAKTNPSKYKQILLDEIMDECHVFLSWQHTLLILTGILVIISLYIHLWYIPMTLSVITLLGSKICKNNFETLMMSIGIINILADMFIKSVNEEKNE